MFMFMHMNLKERRLKKNPYVAVLPSHELVSGSAAQFVISVYTPLSLPYFAQTDRATRENVSLQQVTYCFSDKKLSANLT